MIIIPKVIFLVKSWVLNHNVDVVEIIHNPSNFFIIFFSEQTLRSSDKYWDSKLPYLQNPLLRQRARWNSWERLFCFHWKSLQCRTLQNTCLPVWSTRSCKSLRKNCLQMNFTCALSILKWLQYFRVVYKPNEIFCYCFIYGILMRWNKNKLQVWLTRTLLLRVSEETSWLILAWLGQTGILISAMAHLHTDL